MERIHKAVSFLAAVGLAAGLAVSPAAAQLSDSAPGWEPGQPFVVTIQGSAGNPLMVVHLGRIPLASEPCVELVLPDLGDTGMAYAVSTRGDPARQRLVPPDVHPDGIMKKDQEVVGRIRTVVIPSPANPAFGKAPGTWLAVGAQGMEHWLVPQVPTVDDVATCSFGGYQVPGSGTLAKVDGLLGFDETVWRRTMDGDRAQGTPHEGGKLRTDPPVVIPPDDLYGGQRRVMRPITPGDSFPRTGRAVPGHADGVLTGGGDRATGFDAGGSGPQEAAAAGCTFGGYQVPGGGVLAGSDPVLGLDPAATRRTLDPGVRPRGERLAPPTRPDPDDHVLRPIDTVPFPGTLFGPDASGAEIGQARFILGVGPQGLTFGNTHG